MVQEKRDRAIEDELLVSWWVGRGLRTKNEGSGE